MAYILPLMQPPAQPQKITPANIFSIGFSYSRVPRCYVTFKNSNGVIGTVDIYYNEWPAYYQILIRGEVVQGKTATCAVDANNNVTQTLL